MPKRRKDQHHPEVFHGGPPGDRGWKENLVNINPRLSYYNHCFTQSAVGCAGLVPLALLQPGSGHTGNFKKASYEPQTEERFSLVFGLASDAPPKSSRPPSPIPRRHSSCCCACLQPYLLAPQNVAGSSS